MTRARRLGAAIGLLVLLLFAGRWVAGMLADRWWATELSPAAAEFLTKAYILRAILKVAGVLVASAWFIGHLLAVYRSVGSVQVRRHVANIEIREALTPKTLLTTAVVGGTLLGVAVGGRMSSWWQQVALAWHGVTYGIVDPLLERDLGLYVAQLPLWHAAHGFVFLLVVLALGIVFGLYILVGAIKWLEGRPAINDHARRHIGWLLLAFAGALAWGYLLEPYEIVAGLMELPPGGSWHVVVAVAPVLAGVALATGGLSAVWAAQPRHTLAVASWLVLAVASIAGHWLLPAMFENSTAAATDARSVERLTRMAYGLETARVERVRANDTVIKPARPALWTAPMVSRVTGGDSLSLFWTDPALLQSGGAGRPAWLVLRPIPNDERVVVWAIADDRVGPGGSPLFYRPNDTVAYTSPTALADLPAEILRPDAPRYRMRSDSAAGVSIDAWPKRLALTWALQAAPLLGSIPPGARVDWHLSPSIRLAHLAPFAEWGTPAIRIVDGEVVWMVDGYVTSRTFPLAHRTRWRNHMVGAVQAGFVGVVDAATGAVHIYLRPGAGALAVAWASLSEGVVEPAKNIPAVLLQNLPYPAELFHVQAQEFARSPWRAGALSGRPAPSSPPDELPRTDIQWGADSTGPVQVAVYDQPDDRTVAALLIGAREDGRDVLRLFRLDSTASLPSQAVLKSRWARFPSYDMLNDSVQEDGGRLDPGPVRYEPVRGGIVAYQAHFARRPTERPAIVWLSVAATGNHLGAGRSFDQAWNNLLGGAAPEPNGAGERDRLADARAWLIRADSALRSGNWVLFGRAWRELQRSLGAGDSTSHTR